MADLDVDAPWSKSGAPRASDLRQQRIAPQMLDAREFVGPDQDPGDETQCDRCSPARTARGRTC